MIDTSVLRELGLSTNEIETYLALLKLRNATAQEVSRATHIQRSNIYDILYSLTAKGLIAQSFSGSRKMFTPTSPKELILLLKEKEDRLKKLTDELTELANSRQQLPKLDMSHGILTLRVKLEAWLEKPSPILAYGISLRLINAMSVFFNAFHQKRIMRKDKMKMIFTDDCRKLIKQLNNMPVTEVRFLRGISNNPLVMFLCCDEAIIFASDKLELKEKPLINIMDNSIVSGLEAIFELLWNNAENV